MFRFNPFLVSIGLMVSLVSAGLLSAQSPGQEAILLAEARRLRDEGRLSQAAGTYARLLEFSPGAWEVRSELAQVLITLRELDAAEHHLQRAILTTGGQAMLWSRLGQVYLLKEDMEHAELSLIEARRLDPDDAGVRYNLALLYEKAGRNEEALHEYLAVLDRGEERGILLTAARKVAQYYEVNDSQKAIPYYRRLVELAPEEAYAHKQLANLLYRMARYDEAYEEYEILERLAPEDAATQFNLGFIAKLRGDLATAERKIGRSIALTEPTSKALYNLGAVQYELEKYEAAAESFEKAIALEPDHIQAHYHYARALMKLGRREEALREMQIHKEVLKRRDEEHPSKTMDRTGEDG